MNWDWLLVWRPNTALMRPVGDGHMNLPPRRLNLTELQVFAGEMASRIGRNRDDYQLIRPGWRDGGMHDEQLQWDDLRTLLPEQLAQVQVVATNGLRVFDGSGPMPQELNTLRLSLGGGSWPVVLGWEGKPGITAQDLVGRWNSLGSARPSWWAIWPLLLATAVLAVVVPSLVAVVTGAMPVWLLPTAAALAWLVWVTGRPLARARIERTLRDHCGLDIDFNDVEGVRRERATRRLQWQSGALGAAIGAVATGGAAVLTYLADR